VAVLPQLTSVDSYRACAWDFKADPQGRRYWVDLFCGDVEQLTSAIVRSYPQTSPDKLAALRAEYLKAIRALDAEPERFERIDLLRMGELRHDLLERYGVPDAYEVVKRRENELALGLVDGVLAELDASPADTLPEKLAFGLMAGNIFDLGAMAATHRYQAQRSDFLRLRAAQPPRPWFIDHLDAWEWRWADGEPYAHVAFFVDNAGFDIALGCIPLARWMLQKGSRVTLVANSQPALNDVTAAEAAELVQRIGARDPVSGAAWADGRLAVIGSGNRSPLIDLTQLEAACARAIADADLIILHGMGRAVESNSEASFSCDSLRVAVLKDPAVARWAGGRLLDCVFRFERVT
jgi:type II pantothenate kinase